MAVYATTDELKYFQFTEALCIPAAPAAEICSFLGVEWLPLCTQMRKVHYKPYSEFVSNWAEVCATAGYLSMRGDR